MTAILLALTSHDDLAGLRPTGFYVPDAAHSWRVFQSAGFAVDLVSVRGGRPPMEGFDGGDSTQREFVALPDLASTRRTADVDAVGYDGIFFVGGHGAMWDFRHDAGIARLGRDIYETDGVVAAVGHGGAALVELTLSNGIRLIDGKEVSVFTDDEEEAMYTGGIVPFRLQTTVEGYGAKPVIAPNFECQVSVADRLVTGQNPASVVSTAEEVVRLLAQRSF